MAPEASGSVLTILLPSSARGVGQSAGIRLRSGRPRCSTDLPFRPRFAGLARTLSESHCSRTQAKMENQCCDRYNKQSPNCHILLGTRLSLLSSQALSIDGRRLLHFCCVEKVPARRCCHFNAGIFAENHIVSTGDPSIVER